MASGDYGFSPSVFQYSQMDEDYTDTSQFLWDSPQPDTPAFQEASDTTGANMRMEDRSPQSQSMPSSFVQQSSLTDSKGQAHLDVPHQQGSTPSSASETSSHSSSSDSSARRKRKAPSGPSTAGHTRGNLNTPGGSGSGVKTENLFGDGEAIHQFDESAFPSMGAGMGNLSLDAINNSGKQRGFDFAIPGGSPPGMPSGMFNDRTSNFSPQAFASMAGVQSMNASPQMTVQPSKTFYLGDSREDSPNSVNLMNSHESSPGAFFNGNSPMGRDAFGMGAFGHSTGIGAIDFESNTLDMANVSSHSVSPPSSGAGVGTKWPCKLTVGSTPEKSRVETQIPVKLTLENVPAGVTKLHLPAHTISKPKFQSKPAFQRSRDTLELGTMLVCASAMQKDGMKERAFERATSDEVPVRTEPAGSIDEDDPARPLNGGAVTICQGCIVRERKRAARKKTKKQEEEEEWAKDEAKRVIVFNCPEVRDWCVPQTKEVPVKDHNGPIDAVFVSAPMRIACYCRHQGEKLGFRVIFTIKTFDGTVLAQAMSDSIMITDDHKQPMSHSQHASTGQYPNAQHMSLADRMMAQEGIYPSTFSQDMPFRTSWSTNDLRLLGNQYAPQRGPPTFQRQTSSGTAPSQDSTASATPRNLSRPASPTDPQGHSVKKRRSGGPGHAKVPSGLTMTRLENRSPNSNHGARSGAPQSAGLPPSNFQFPNLTGSGLGSPLDQSFQTPTSAPQFQSGPTTPMTTLQSGFGNFENDYQFYSAPTSQHPSRPASPTSSRMQISSQVPQQAAFALESLPAGLNLNRPPIIQRLIPNTGSIRGGEEVTILGSGFIQGLEVMFGDRIASNTTFWGETTLVCRAPPSSREGSVSVVFKHQHRSALPQLRQLTGLMPTVQIPYYYTDDEKPQMQGLGLSVAAQQRMMDGGRLNQEDLARQLMSSAGGYGNFSLGGGSGVGAGQIEQQNMACDAMDEGLFEDRMVKCLEYLDMNDSPYRPAYDKRNQQGATLLSLAAGRGYNRLVAGLLARGANPDCRDRSGFTSLMMASLRGQASTARLLLFKGADPTVRSLCGYTASDLASDEQTITSIWSCSLSCNWNAKNRRVDREYRRPSSSPSLDSVSGLSTSSQPSEPASLGDGNKETVGMVQDENPAMRLAAAAFAAWRDQLLTQLHHFQQNMPHLSTLQPKLSIYDYQQHPMVRRISDMFTTSTSPPAYEDIYPCSQTTGENHAEKSRLVSPYVDASLARCRDEKAACTHRASSGAESTASTATPGRVKHASLLTLEHVETSSTSTRQVRRIVRKVLIFLLVLLVGLVLGFFGSGYRTSIADITAKVVGIPWLQDAVYVGVRAS